MKKQAQGDDVGDREEGVLPETRGVGVKYCLRGVRGSLTGSSALPWAPCRSGHSPLSPALPWSWLSPPGSPASSMARRHHPCRYRRCLRGPGHRLAPRVPVPEPSQGAQQAVPMPDQHQRHCPRGRWDRPSHGSPARLNPSQPAVRGGRGWSSEAETGCGGAGFCSLFPLGLQ